MAQRIPRNYFSRYADKPSCVYTLSDGGGNVLYVGMTTDLDRRMAEHRRKQPWAHLIVITAAVWYPNRDQAKAAERYAIATKKPIFNATRPRAVSVF